MSSVVDVWQLFGGWGYFLRVEARAIIRGLGVVFLGISRRFRFNNFGGWGYSHFRGLGVLAGDLLSLSPPPASTRDKMARFDVLKTVLHFNAIFSHFLGVGCAIIPKCKQN